MTHTTLIRDTQEYHRNNLTPDQHARTQMEYYLTHVRKLTPDEIKHIMGKVVEQQSNPTVLCYQRENMADKHLTTIALGDYLGTVAKRKAIMVPTLTTYLGKHEVISFHSEMIAYRLEWRNKVKQVMYDLETENDKVGATYQSLLQVAIKTGSNTISGIYGIQGTPIANKSTHSTLTSTTRVTTNTSNILLERLLSGTIMFRHVDSARSYLLALLIEYQGKAATINACIDTHQLAIPSIDQLMTWIKTNTNKYWVSKPSQERIHDLCSALDGYQRAYLLYAGSLWNIAQSNQDFVRGILDTMLSPPPVDDQLELAECLAIIKGSNDDVLNAVHHIHWQSLEGVGNNHYKMTLPHVQRIATTVRYLHDYITTNIVGLTPLLIIDTLPPDIGYTRSMRRTTILGSDTDSNIGTVENWASWYIGHTYPTDKAIQMLGVVACFAGMISDDALRQLSINLGICEADINVIEMKSEYSPLMLTLVTLTKTYFQLIKIKEKSVLKSPKMIIKGVHLKSSNSPPHLLQQANALMKLIGTNLSKGESLNMTSILNGIMTTEREIIESVLRGRPEYLRALRINPSTSYKNPSPLENNSGWADFWSDVIQIPLPTRFVKIPTTLTNKTKLTSWVDSLPSGKREHVAKWLTARRKKDLPTIYIPLDYVSAHGLPNFLHRIVAIDSILSDVCNIFYIVLMGLGYFKQKQLCLLESEGYDLAEIIETCKLAN